MLLWCWLLFNWVTKSTHTKWIYAQRFFWCCQQNQIISTRSFWWWIHICFFWHESLFTTNVSLQRTISIILDRVYINKLIATQLKKRTVKKLIKDTYNTTFSAKNKLYQQIDGVRMGSSLGALLANITDKKKRVLESRFNKVAGLQACNFIKKRHQHKWLLWLKWTKPS